MKAKTGLILFLLSFAIWGLVFTLPFVPLANSVRAAFAVLIYIVSYTLFFSSGWILCGGRRPSLSETLSIGKETLRTTLGGRRPQG